MNKTSERFGSIFDGERREARLIVVGVGGAGNNAVNHMIDAELAGAEFLVLNTDAQVLASSRAQIRLQLGDKLTKGLGAGGDPRIGERAAEESEDEVRDALTGADMVFVAAGMGGGTGTGAAPVVASIARDLGALTVAVVTMPFSWEGQRRKAAAEDGIEQLRDKVDALIVVPNDRLLTQIDRRVSLSEAFKVADSVLRQGIQGITDVITVPGLINVDFADVRSIMDEAGSALMSIGRGTGETRTMDAATQAITSPLLEVSIQGATRVLLNVTGGEDLALLEVSEAAEIVHAAVDPNANIIIGAVIDPNMNGEVRVTLVATGLRAERSAVQEPLPQNVKSFPVAKPAPPQPAPRTIQQQAPQPVQQPAAEQQYEPMVAQGGGGPVYQPSIQNAIPAEQPTTRVTLPDVVARPAAVVPEQTTPRPPAQPQQIPTQPQFQPNVAGGVPQDDLDIPAFLRRMQASRRNNQGNGNG